MEAAQPARQVGGRVDGGHAVAAALLAGRNGDGLPVGLFLVGALALEFLSTLRSASSGVMLATPSSVVFRPASPCVRWR